MRLPLIILFLTNTLHAQSSLRNDYSIHDPCQNPKIYHIASRTIYTNNGFEPTSAVDTTFEKYDRNGNLIALEYFKSSPNKQQTQRIYHHFFYDAQQRIVRDSHDIVTTITYIYSLNGDTVIVNNPTAYCDGEIVKSVIWYDLKKGDTTEIGMNGNGDTIYRLHAARNLRIEISQQRNEFGFMKIIDSAVTYTRTDMKYTMQYFFDQTGVCSTAMDILRFDKRGRVTVKEHFWENNFRKSIEHLEYNKKGQLSRSISTIYPHHYLAAETEITKWEMKSLYDPKGRIAQTQSWNHKRPHLLHLTSYIYNERNILVEIHRVLLAHGAVIEDEREHWIYTYY